MKKVNYIKYFGTMLLAAFFVGNINTATLKACNIDESSILIVNLCIGGLIGWFWPNIYRFLGLDQ